ncbi:MAG TPA: hypothetical protein VNJ12_06440 [Candidatus Dormibacteraeota bacterium]|nr:hypothetical protein [Candidatus Dormibacteraeota bacterium]
MNSPLQILVVLFCVSVVVFLLMLFYKSHLERKGEEAFRTTPERLNDQQKALLKKVDGMSKPMWIVGTLMVLLLLSSIGLWIFLGLGL